MRLTDVPEDVRMRAARRMIRDETDPMEQLRIMLLAVKPPADLVAWLRP